MKIGIVGFQGSGKTTLFNALTGQDAPTGYSGDRVNLGTIKVPDHRLDRLAELAEIEKAIYSEITFADVPGGRGAMSLDPKTLGRIREMDALVQVIRGFDDGNEPSNPAADLASFEAELILADMQVAEKRVERLEKDLSDPRQLKLLGRCLEKMSDEKPLRRVDLTDEERASLSGFAFLSLKPLLIVLNLAEDRVSAPIPDDVARLAGERDLSVMPLSGPIEAEIATLEPDDQQEFLADLGLDKTASRRFIRSAFAMLDLISFLTCKPDECRSWPIRRGSTALEAAGAVHSDIARGFIRAEVIHFDDLDRLGSEAACRDAGKLRIEGKQYIVEEGDICFFRFNI
ncbi:MAG: redox-regulated ATPase YchF [Proteobacteria bacterium]|nr:redox-regulated ATPase YchF [Pseudomonadota bacterium]